MIVPNGADITATSLRRPASDHALVTAREAGHGASQESRTPLPRAVVWEERCDRHVESSCQAGDLVEADVALASLDRPDIGAVKARGISERLLRQPAIQAERPNLLPELTSSLMLRLLRHAPDVGLMLPMSRQTMSSITLWNRSCCEKRRRRKGALRVRDAGAAHRPRAHGGPYTTCAPRPAPGVLPHAPEQRRDGATRRLLQAARPPEARARRGAPTSLSGGTGTRVVVQPPHASQTPLRAVPNDPPRGARRLMLRALSGLAWRMASRQSNLWPTDRSRTSKGPVAEPYRHPQSQSFPRSGMDVPQHRDRPWPVCYSSGLCCVRFQSAEPGLTCRSPNHLPGNHQRTARPRAVRRHQHPGSQPQARPRGL